MNNLLEWLTANKEWMFSGVGITVLAIGLKVIVSALQTTIHKKSHESNAIVKVTSKSGLSVDIKIRGDESEAEIEKLIRSAQEDGANKH